SGLRVPDLDQVVHDGADEPPAVRAPGKPTVIPHPWRDDVQSNRPELLPAGGVPDSDRALDAEARQTLAVRPEGDAGDPFPVPPQHVPDFAVGEADQVSRGGRMLA